MKILVLTHLRSGWHFFRYSAGQVFAGRFIYFLLFAVAVFLFVTVIHAVEEAVPPNAGQIYYFMLAPAMLLTFYPSAYAIQSDVDARMLETLFGIPDYRYKVWLARQVVQQIVIGTFLLMLALLCQAALADFSVMKMVFHLMFPVLFFGCLGFALATIVRSGNGAAAVLVSIGLFLWILTEPLEGSRWNLFYNPFAQLEAYEAMVQSQTTFYNRAYLLAGSGALLLLGLLRLQQRERYMQG